MLTQVRMMDPKHEIGLRRWAREAQGSDVGQAAFDLFAEIDSLRAQLAAQSAEIERLTKDLDALMDQFAMAKAETDKVWGLTCMRDEYKAKSERLESESAAMREALECVVKAAGSWRSDILGLHKVGGVVFDGRLQDPTSTHLWREPDTDRDKHLVEAERLLTSTTAGTDLLARLQAAEKEQSDLSKQAMEICVEKARAEGALSATESIISVLERDMRTLVEALKEANRYQVGIKADAMIEAALTLPSVQRLMKGE